MYVQVLNANFYLVTGVYFYIIIFLNILRHSVYLHKIKHSIIDFAPLLTLF